MIRKQTKRLLVLAVTIYLYPISSPPAKAESTIVDAQKAFASQDYRTCMAISKKEIESNAGNEEAYALLARSYEELGQTESAIELWGQLKAIASTDKLRQEARLGLLRTRGPDIPEFTAGDEWKGDPYKVDIGKINWDRLKADVEQTKIEYIDNLPSEVIESRYFQLVSATEYSCEVFTKLCEAYTSFLLEKYFVPGQEWVLHVPVVVYKNHSDYVQKGGFPNWSAGVTMTNPYTGAPKLIALYMLNKDGELDRDSVEGTLPHELTHMVLHEFFGGAEIPRWLDEGMAQRMEQTRDHYIEAAKIGRDAIAGEYYRFRELFTQEGYPPRSDRSGRFYEQSATIVLFLLEQGGPDSAAAFLQALKEGKDHDEAVAGALGIPKEGAVDEFEKRWFEWARRCYLQHREKLEEADTVTADIIQEDVFTQSFAFGPTVEKIEKWSTVPTDSLDKFRSISGSAQYWSSDGGRLVCNIENNTRGSLLGIRLDEETPMVMRCKVRAKDGSATNPTLVGITMLDHRADDTGVQVTVPLIDRKPHTLTCMISDDIAIYLDDTCTGRSPAFDVKSIDEDVDWPLALVGYAPFEVYEIEAGMIEEDGFVKATVASAETGG